LDYATRGIELREVSTGFRVQVRAESASVVSRLWQERPAKYSRALLETLALIAYRQPITRGEIEDIRGVAVNPNIIRTLQERGWIRTVGYREVPGRPELLGTTREFLDYFGLKSLDNLPTLKKTEKHNIDVVVDRIKVRSEEDAKARDALRRIKLGQVVRAEIVRPRSLQYHRRFFAMLNVVWAACGDWPTVDELLTELS
jgi:segregation and condensation protein B